MLELAGRVSNISDEELCFDKQNHFVFKCELLTKLAQAQNERLCVTDGSLQWTQSVSWSLSEGTARSLSDEKIICIIPAPNSKWEKALKMLNVDVRLGQAGPLPATGVGWYKLLADCLLCPSCCWYTTTPHTSHSQVLFCLSTSPCKCSSCLVKTSTTNSSLHSLHGLSCLSTIS